MEYMLSAEGISNSRRIGERLCFPSKDRLTEFGDYWFSDSYWGWMEMSLSFPQMLHCDGNLNFALLERRCCLVNVDVDVSIYILSTEGKGVSDTPLQNRTYSKSWDESTPPWGPRCFTSFLLTLYPGRIMLPFKRNLETAAYVFQNNVRVFYNAWTKWKTNKPQFLLDSTRRFVVFFSHSNSCAKTKGFYTMLT